jgi:amidase
MSADPIHYKSIIELSDLFRRGELLPSKVTEAIVSRIDKLDGKFHSYALVLAERAMAQAKLCDAELAKGIWRGPLHGVPIGLKDLCYTTFAPTAGGTTRHLSIPGASTTGSALPQADRARQPRRAYASVRLALILAARSGFRPQPAD